MASIMLSMFIFAKFLLMLLFIFAIIILFIFAIVIFVGVFKYLWEDVLNMGGK